MVLQFGQRGPNRGIVACVIADAFKVVEEPAERLRIDALVAGLMFQALQEMGSKSWIEGMVARNAVLGQAAAGFHGVHGISKSNERIIR